MEKKLDILYFGDIKQVQGVNKVTETFLKGKYLLLENGIKLNKIYSKGLILDCDENEKLPIGEGTDTFKYNLVRKSRTFVKENLFLQSRTFDWFKIKKNFIEPGKGVVSNYKKKSDYILFQDIFTAYYYLKKEKSKKGTNIILHTSEDPLKQLKLSYPNIIGTKYEIKLNEILKFVLETIENVIFVSKQPIEQMTNMIPRDYNYVHNGLENIKCSEKKWNNSKKLKIICVGSINHRKGQDLLIEGINLLSNSEKNKIELSLVGEGSKREQLENNVEKYGLEKNIKFLGLIKNVKKELEKNNLFVLSSRDEGLPISILEAMREGLPIIGTKVGGIPELITDGEDGLLIAPDPQEFKKKLQDILNGKIDLNEFGKKSRLKFEKEFDFGMMIKKYANIIKKENNE